MVLRTVEFDPDANPRTADARATDSSPIGLAPAPRRYVRDIHVTRRAGGKWAPSRAGHADGWTIDACPVNGPMLSAKGQNVALAWFTVQQDQGHAFVAFSPDAGKVFGTPVRLDDNAALGRSTSTR